MAEQHTPKMSSVLGETAVIIGNVTGTGDLEIRGRVQGSVSLAGRVLVAESGTVLGGIEATDIAVAGEVRGDLVANDGVEVHASGRVEGNIEAPRVGIEAGARVRGMLRTGVELKSSESDRKSLQKSTKKAPPRPHLEEKVRPAPQGNGPLTSAPEKSAQRDARPEPSKPQAEPEFAAGHKRAFKGKHARRKGPPAPPTFVKGAHGRSK